MTATRIDLIGSRFRIYRQRVPAFLLPLRLRHGHGEAAVAGRTTVRPETQRALITLGLRVGQWSAFLTPILGLLVFGLVAFRPAVTLYVGIVGLGMVLLKRIELTRRSFELQEIVRRKVHDYDTH
jgi:hypothetical protein